MATASRAFEVLEPRRLLSADVAAPTDPEPDLPIADDSSDVVIAEGREEVYPPLAPAMWADESVGSFEEPAEITIAFFPPDPVNDTPPDDEAVAPPVADAAARPARIVERPESIAREVLDAADEVALSE